MGNIEVELKFQILDDKQIKNFLTPIRFINRKRIVDTYLDTEDADLYKRGLFIRIRDDRTLDFKFNLKDDERKHEHCEEHSIQLPLNIGSLEEINKICDILGLASLENPSLEEFKFKNNFVKSIIIDKNREKYEDENFTFSFDDVRGLGKFLEIETHTTDESVVEKIKDKMRDRIRGLKLKLITTGYNELYWKKHNIEIYKQGMYHLEEDKNEI